MLRKCVMKLRKIITALLSLVILLSSIPAFDLTASAAAMPYRITVDLTNQIVTVYSTADDTVVRQMLCSTGLKGSTPRGTYYLPKKLKSDERSEWFYFSSFSCYAHYATRVYMGIMFHSIPYATRRESSISKTALAEFGRPASHGCIRLRTEDAKFIALNCLPGTQCKIYRSNKTDEDLRALLMDSSYSADSGLSYKQFLGIPDEPGVLGRYSKGTEVEDLQYRLRALGFYTGPITGEYSGATVTSVKELQDILGQEQNGAATKELQELVFSSEAPTAMNVTLTQGISGPAVRNLQQNLQALCLYNDEIDGVYDIDVADAVKRFQQAYGTTADGVANTTVQKAIDYEANRLAAVFAESSGYSCEETTEPMTLASISSQISIRIRSKPTTKSDALGKATYGMLLVLLETQGDWARVRRGENEGFVMKKYLAKLGDATTRLDYISTDGSVRYSIGHTVSDYNMGADFPSELFIDYLANGGSTEEVEVDVEEVTAEALVLDTAFATVTTSSDGVNLNLRENPSTESAILAELPNGTHMQVLLKSAEWTLVSHQGVNGYLMNDYLTYWDGPANALETGYEPSSAPVEDTPSPEDDYSDPVYAVVSSETGKADVFDVDSDDAERIGALPNGTQITVLKTDDDWSYIDYKGNRGYMPNDALEFSLVGEGAASDDEEYTYSEDAVMASVIFEGGKAPVYGAASDTSQKIGELPTDTEVAIVSSIGEWSLIDYQGNQGYMKNNTLKIDGEEHAQATPAPEEAIRTGTAYAYSLSGKAPVYDGVSSSAKELGTLAHGTELLVVVNNGEWSLIDYQGKQGYMKNENLRFSMVSEDVDYEIIARAIVKSESGKAAVFDGGANTAIKIGQLKEGDEVGIIESAEHWSFIDYKGNQGYMRNVNLYTVEEE